MPYGNHPPYIEILSLGLILQRHARSRNSHERENISSKDRSREQCRFVAHKMRRRLGGPKQFLGPCANEKSALFWSMMLSPIWGGRTFPKVAFLFETQIT